MMNTQQKMTMSPVVMMLPRKKKNMSRTPRGGAVLGGLALASLLTFATAAAALWDKREPVEMAAPFADVWKLDIFQLPDDGAFCVCCAAMLSLS